MAGSGSQHFRSTRKLIESNWARIPRAVEWFDDFLGDTVNTDMWTTAADTGCTTLAINVQAGGVGRLATDSTDEDRADAGGPLIFKPSNGIIYAEARIKCDVVTDVCINFGLIDASTEASQVTAFSMATGTTFTTIPVDGVGWFYDIDATTDIWRGIGVKANTDTAPVLGTAQGAAAVPVAGAYDKLGILIGTAGDAGFFLNDVKIGSVAAATTATTFLAPYVAVKNRAAGAHNLDIDYVYVAQQLGR